MHKSASLNRLKNNNNNSKKYVIMSSIKEQVLAQQQGQYNESDDKYLAALKQYKTDLNDEEVEKMRPWR